MKILLRRQLKMQKESLGSIEKVIEEKLTDDNTEKIKALLDDEINKIEALRKQAQLTYDDDTDDGEEDSLN